MPGADETTERAMVEAFLVPVLIGDLTAVTPRQRERVTR